MTEITSAQDQPHPKTVSHSFLPLIFSIFSFFMIFNAVKPNSAGLFIAMNTQKPLVIRPTATKTKTPTRTPTIAPSATPTVTATPLPPERAQLRFSEQVTNLDVLFASHIIANRPKAANEYRVVFIGDSGTWSHYMPAEETLAGRLDAAQLQTCDSRTVRVYNMGLRATSLVKDLVFIDKAVTYQPDLVIWFLTLNTFRPDTQLSGKNFMPVNRAYITDLSKRYDLGLNTASLTTNQQTAEQAWEIVRTAVEPSHNDSYPLLSNDLVASSKFTAKLLPPTLPASSLPFNLFNAGLKILSSTKVLVVNEPIFIASGLNSNLRYNEYYPRWAYDQFRQILLKDSQANNWKYLDLWNAIPPENFTGTPLHRTPPGEQLMFKKLTPIIKNSACP